ncbi:MAG: TadE/TadG family type IV pilus assembly protein [Pseudomonadota bacterium]
MPHKRSSFIRKLQNILNKGIYKRQFYKQTRGVAATEFAMIVPVLVMLYMGSVEMGQALSVDRKVTSVASSAADLVSQSSEVSQNDIDDIFNIAQAIMEPYDNTSTIITISSVVSDQNNNQSVDWSVSNTAGNAHAQGATIPGMPATITEENSSVIVAEVQYTYSSPVSYYVTGPMVLSDTFYARPRQSVSVNFTN